MIRKAVIFLGGSSTHLPRIVLKRRDSSFGHWTKLVTNHRFLPGWGLAAGLAATALIAQPTLATAQNSTESPDLRFCKWLESQGADLSGIEVEVGFMLPAKGWTWYYISFVAVLPQGSIGHHRLVAGAKPAQSSQCSLQSRFMDTIARRSSEVRLARFPLDLAFTASTLR